MSAPILPEGTPPASQSEPKGTGLWRKLFSEVKQIWPAFLVIATLIAFRNDFTDFWRDFQPGVVQWFWGLLALIFVVLWMVLWRFTSTDHSPLAARAVAQALLGLVVLGVLGVVLWIRPGEPERLPDVSLVGMSYMVDHWDPRRIDLTRVGESGIPVSTNHLLEFVDIAVSVTEDAPDYVGHIEVYQDSQHKDLVGKSESFPLTKGVKTLEAIQATQYNQRASDDEKDRLIWRVPPDWIGKALHVALVIYRKGQQEAVHVAVTDVLIDPAGKAWFLGSPNAALALVAYNVNGGETKVIDPRVMAEKGLDAKPNDTLNIEEIWYTSNASGGALHTEAYLTAGGFNKQTFKSTRATIAEKGIGALTDISPPALTWEIPDDLRWLVLSLVRDDGVVLDRWVPVLNGANGSTGLVPKQALSLDLIAHEDFERPADLNQWSVNDTTQITTTTETAFSGNAALAVKITGPTGKNPWTNWLRPFKADYLIGQAYCPDNVGASMAWAQVCVVGLWKCFDLCRTRNRWDTFAIDLVDAGANTNEWPGIIFQGSIEGASAANPYVFYLDDLQVYSTR